jgi:SM-20-related protein
VISPQAIQQFGEAQVRQFLQGALKRASRGFSFVHLSYAMQDEYARDPTPPIHRATELLQSRAFLDLGAAVIGRRSGRRRARAGLELSPRRLPHPAR